MWVRGLKLVRQEAVERSLRSHPMWVRGLKPDRCATSCMAVESHPMWVRGLKPSQFSFGYNDNEVAPYVGAWIETRESL